MCLGPEAGVAFDIREVPRRKPGPDEVEIAVEAASVNPIDVRAAGYGQRLLSLMGASRFPMTLGNDFAGVVTAVGSGRASGFAIGERVYGVKPPSKRRNARLPCARKGRPRVEGACEPRASGGRGAALLLRNDMAGCGAGRRRPSERRGKGNSAWARWPCSPSPNGERA